MSESKPAKTKKQWQPNEEDSFTPLQKGLIIAVVLFVPFLLFIILPIVVRNHLVENLKIPRELFLSPPDNISLVRSKLVPPTYKVNINGVTFRIPESYTPVRVNDNSCEFRPEPRRVSRSIEIAALDNPKKLKYSPTGLVRFFLPTSMLKFMQTVLRATWHPIRLTFKAHLFANEGINGKIFEARWDAHNRGFIFPTPGNKGYLGRVFRTNGPGYFEFSYNDPIFSITLQDWVDLAMKIKPSAEAYDNSLASQASRFSLPNLIKQAEMRDTEPVILGDCLSEFFRTTSPQWLIPVAMVMENRGFYPEVIELHKQYIKSFAIDSPVKLLWNDILDRTVQKILKLEIDPKLSQKELRVYCKNLTKLQIKQAIAKIDIQYLNGTEKSFLTKLIRSGRLFEQQEKTLSIEVPSDITLNEFENITCRIMQVDFLR